MHSKSQAQLIDFGSGEAQVSAVYEDAKELDLLTEEELQVLLDRAKRDSQ